MQNETIYEILENTGIVEICEEFLGDENYVLDIINNDDVLKDELEMRVQEYMEDDGYVDGEDEDGLNPSYGELADWYERACDWILEEHKEKILKVITSKLYKYLNSCYFDKEFFKLNF